MLAKIKQTWSMDDVLKKVIEEIQTDPSSYNHFTWQNGEWRRKGKLVVGQKDDLKKEILKWMHSSPIGGTFGKEGYFKAN